MVAFLRFLKLFAIKKYFKKIVGYISKNLYLKAKKELLKMDRLFLNLSISSLICVFLIYLIYPLFLVILWMEILSIYFGLIFIIDDKKEIEKYILEQIEEIDLWKQEEIDHEELDEMANRMLKSEGSEELTEMEKIRASR